ncbi:uncharacterized protein [Blastocystis hominis]|uniref:EGF-like domain-containing protein n=1 Tax=Blastocystis hominis TaxID=12968 RepID=D8LX27_BLAHO|nr:uncharacterized protein [Blastocystis hominis]CBK20822.2 unnamed protein product [Blastocystis hominis]|eukprot:XP_012894870.1 uncharacterized protein [Blastocystis hominis]
MIIKDCGTPDSNINKFNRFYNYHSDNCTFTDDYSPLRGFPHSFLEANLLKVHFFCILSCFMFSSILSVGLLVFIVSSTTVQGQKEIGFDLFEVSEDEVPCAPGCSHNGVCWEEMDICNCTSLFEGDRCESLNSSLKLWIIVISLAAMLGIIYYFCRKGSSNKRYQVPSLPVVDPFISSLDRIRNSDSAKQMWMGDKFQSRDSYLKSNQQRKERWWKPKQKYSSVPVDET